MKKLLYLFTFLMVSAVGAQEEYAPVIQNYLNGSRTDMGLQAQDVAEIDVNSSAFSKSMNVHTVYATQMHNGVEVFNSVSSFAVRNGQVLSAASSFEANVASRINTTTASLQPETAIARAASSLGLSAPSGMELLQTEGNSYLYSNGSISLNEIPVKLVYFVQEDNSMRLAWDLSIYLLDASHYYHVRVDANTGELLDTLDWVVSCSFDKGAHAHDNGDDNTSVLFANKAQSSAIAAGGAAYNVFAIPLRNPANGAETVVTSPEDLTASPFGWHDTDGAGGAEFTITRGNNVLAQEDLDGNNGSGASPDGGATLDFSGFAYGLPQAPANFIEAATVNLFYWNNVCHDVTYLYGFDEESGNFQENNYGNPGNGSDSVNADAQDGSGTNNANFATPPDGGNPRMQMFTWDGAAGPVADILTINAGPLAGEYSGIPAGFGGVIPNPALTEDIVLVIDDDSGVSTDPNDACDVITNGADLSGKIAILRRGECEFGFKALAAQTEGAVAVIIVNNVAGDPILMGGGAVGAGVTIPLFMVNDIDGEAIIADITANGPLNGTISGENVGVDLDGDLDNEIVAHEYAHGVSNRLTGGPINTSCLGNADQMGEGWSDYLGLILTMQTGDQPEDIRGLASYASQNPNGIREAPYSTDLAINDFTYADTNTGVSQPHGIGFVWATMLWDMTWSFIDEYGFDADIYNGTGGNNIAFQLVMDGMKLQACSPGFVDGRDAIIMADELANAGANRCRIWQAFAARGLGLSASQGSTNNRADAVEAFDLPADCALSISDNEFSRNFSIYPNPSNGQINISSVVSLGATDISIVDINGRTVFTQTVELGNQASIEATNLSSGIYIIKIDGGNYVHTAKLVIE